MIHFDTNFLVQTLVAGSAAHEKFRSWTQAPEDCNASCIAWAEFLCGPLDPPPPPSPDKFSPDPNHSCRLTPNWPPAYSTRRGAGPGAWLIA
jgi:hypothetical protein